MTRAIITKPCEGCTIAIVGDVYRFLATRISPGTARNKAASCSILPSSSEESAHHDLSAALMQPELAIWSGNHRVVA